MTISCAAAAARTGLCGRTIRWIATSGYRSSHPAVLLDKAAVSSDWICLQFGWSPPPVSVLPQSK